MYHSWWAGATTDCSLCHQCMTVCGNKWVWQLMCCKGLWGVGGLEKCDINTGLPTKCKAFFSGCHSEWQCNGYLTESVFTTVVQLICSRTHGHQMLHFSCVWFLSTLPLFKQSKRGNPADVHFGWLALCIIKTSSGPLTDKSLMQYLNASEVCMFFSVIKLSPAIYNV